VPDVIFQHKIIIRQRDAEPGKVLWYHRKKERTKCPPERAFHFSKSLTFGRGKVPLANIPSLEYQKNVMNISRAQTEEPSTFKKYIWKLSHKFRKPTEINHGGYLCMNHSHITYTTRVASGTRLEP